jgi:hypothetical protein
LPDGIIELDFTINAAIRVRRGPKYVTSAADEPKHVSYQDEFTTFIVD